MRSHTGGAIMMGKGVLFSKSSKQKLNTKSSTEAELVGASNFLSQTVWTRNFIEAQGYKIDEIEFFPGQHEQRDENGEEWKVVRRMIKVPNINYFFIHDRIQKKEITLLHCPTGIMVIDDFFTAYKVLHKVPSS